jgi:hypothetical protein
MNCRFRLLLALLVAFAELGTANAADFSGGPAYQIVLRSRHAEVTPAKCHKAQTGGGSIIVEQPEPNTIVFTMCGSAVVGSGHGGSNAHLNFDLVQDLTVVPLRSGARPPRIGMIGRVVGTLVVTEPGELGCPCGSAFQGPATANLEMDGASLLNIDVEPSTVACCQKMSINHQSDPVECPAVTTSDGSGQYRLTASFSTGASQCHGILHRQFAVADFDPAPQLDAFWADALKPFRAVPRGENGFRLVVRVVEDAVAPDAQLGMAPLPILEQGASDVLVSRR